MSNSDNSVKKKKNIYQCKIRFILCSCFSFQHNCWILLNEQMFIRQSILKIRFIFGSKLMTFKSWFFHVLKLKHGGGKAETRWRRAALERNERRTEERFVTLRRHDWAKTSWKHGADRLYFRKKSFISPRHEQYKVYSVVRWVYVQSALTLQTLPQL